MTLGTTRRVEKGGTCMAVANTRRVEKRGL